MIYNSYESWYHMKKNTLEHVVLSHNVDCYNSLIEYKTKYCVDDELDIWDIEIKDDNISNEDFSKFSFVNVIIDHCVFSNVIFEKASFKNVIFKNCEFPNCNFTKSFFNNCDFINSQLKGASFTDSSISKLIIEDCNLQYANFTSSKFINCKIYHSNMNDTFFSECKLKDMQLENSSFMRSEFFKTPLKAIDFTSCIIDGIRVSLFGKELSGAIVNTYQAAELSKLLGIKVKD